MSNVSQHTSGYFFLFMSYVTCCNGTYEQFKSNDENSDTLKTKSMDRNI